MFYVVGLGNPGDECVKTRHNIGFLVLDALIDKFGLPEAFLKRNFSGRFSEGRIGLTEVQLLYPETFMNNSGSAIKKMVPKNSVKNLIILYDDMALPLGEVRISFSRGDGGHNGLKSITESLGTKDYIRIRIGIAQTDSLTKQIKIISGTKRAKFVLSNFNRKETEDIKAKVLPKVIEIIVMILEFGCEKAMNKYN